MLYELLTGERPYKLKRDSRGALEEAILAGGPRGAEPRRVERSGRGGARDDGEEALEHLAGRS